MNKTGTTVAVVTAVIFSASLGTSGLAHAQGKAARDIGKQEYEANCVVCHGTRGKGDGSYAELLKRPSSDLTMLKKNNGGVFPFDRVYAVIDGREMLKGHGESEMPIWGKAYSMAGQKAAEHYVDMPYSMESFTRGRILALIDYLNRLQAK
jgi:mono/diheme cytochrome c family protein